MMQLALFKDDAPLAARQPKTDRLVLGRYLKEAGDDKRLDQAAIERAYAILVRSTFKGIHDRSPLLPDSRSTAEHILSTYDTLSIS